jgi:hypothetical protein
VVKSHEGATAIVKAALWDQYRPMLLDIVKSIRALMRKACPDDLLDDERDQKRRDLDSMITGLEGDVSSFLNHGNMAPLDDPTVSADPELARRARARIEQANRNQRRVR